LSAGDESDVTAPPPARIRVRIESLSDMIFGLALSIGSLFLIGRVPQSGHDIAVSVLLFGFGFVIIVMTWLGYSRTMAVLPVEVPYALAANLVLLFVVAVEPYLFYVLESASSLGMVDAASVAYGIDVGAMFLMLAVLANLVVKEGERGGRGQKPLHTEVLARFKIAVKLDFAIGAIFLVSALPFFWVDTPVGFVRLDMWFSSFLIFTIGRVARRRVRAR
jgi:hypothetical protein